MEDESPGEPDVPLTVVALLRRSPRDFVLATMSIGLGVATSWCLGAGVVLMWLGSSWLLAHAARTAGHEPRKMPVYAGFLAVVLATALAGAGLLGGMLLNDEPALAIACASVCVAIMGAALAPLALAPTASACHTSGPLAPMVRAIDLAGSDRFVVLSPLSALIAVCLVIPIPLVVFGLAGLVVAAGPSSGGDAVLSIIAGAVGFVVWMLAVPASAAALTLRHVRLESRTDEPTRISQALQPLFGAAVLGLFALGGSLGAAAVTPTPLRSTLLESPPMRAERDVGRERRAWELIPFPDYPLNDRRGQALQRATCVPPTLDSGEVVIWCESTADRTWFALDRARMPVDAPLRHRIAVRLGLEGAGAAAFALLIVALALLWLGRIGASLRLLAKPPFAIGGVLWSSEAALAFESSDGAHRASVPSSRVLSPPGWAPSDGERAVVLSETPIELVSWRTAGGELPRGAVLVVGSRESALGAAIERARRIGFRLAVLALGALVGAAAWVVHAL